MVSWFGDGTRIAMPIRFQVSWPLGPLEWGERLGWARAVGTLEELRETHGEPYRPALMLRRFGAGDAFGG